jgi:hypothetical protein
MPNTALFFVLRDCKPALLTPLLERAALGEGLVLVFAADVRLIDLHRPGEHGERVVLHGFADAVQHEPGGLLRHRERARDLIGRDAVTGAGDQPNGGKPLVKANRRVLKDRADLGGELPLAFAAVPAPGLRHVRNVGRAAAEARARDAVGPAEVDEERVRLLGIGELPRCFQHGFGDRLLGEFGGLLAGHSCCLLTQA